MAERVIPLELGTRWSVGAPDSVLLCSDFGPTALAMRAHSDDEDQRIVVLFASPSRAVMMGPPNDEGLGSHRLYESGLKEVAWAGEVVDSQWAADLNPLIRNATGLVQDHADPWRHLVLPLKEKCVEMLCEEVDVIRIPASTTAQAIIEVLR